MKRLSFVTQVIGILLVGFVFTFAAGLSVMYAIERSNLEHIYRQTQELVKVSVAEAEAELNSVRLVAYDLVVSDAVQAAGSQYLSLQDQENSLSAQQVQIDTVTSAIQTAANENGRIECVNFLDIHGAVRVVASQGYRRLDAEAAKRVEALAIEARGATILMDGKPFLNQEDMLMVVKELREKKGLSMKHIGVIVLFVDMKDIGKTLTEAYDGIYLLKSDEYGLTYLLGDDAGVFKDPLAPIGTEAEVRGYALSEIDGNHYFITSLTKSKYTFSYQILLPYDALFNEVEHLFTRFVWVFAICCVTALTLCVYLMHRVTGDIRRLKNHIRSVFDVSGIPIREDAPMLSRDSYELYATFNAMAERINRLIQDNYQKRILVKETQLAALQAQINPHFLYNTLNSIYWMAKRTDDKQLPEMIDSLSQLLREATHVNETLVEMDRELEIVFHYARIQKKRYGERLMLTMDVDEDCGHLAIPKFTIQPMLENAIYYGLECMLEPCAVRVRVYTEGADCVCRVYNKGPAPESDLMNRLRRGEIPPKGNGVGLLNIDRRIKAVFGERYGVTVLRASQTEETIVEARFAKRTRTDGEADANARALPNHGG